MLHSRRTNICISWKVLKNQFRRTRLFTWSRQIMASGNLDVSGMQIWYTLSPVLASNDATWCCLLQIWWGCNNPSHGCRWHHTGNSLRAVKRFKEDLGSWYGIKDMGNLQWLLGIGIERGQKNQTISFSQIAYIQKIIEHFEMDDAKPLLIPISPGHNLTKLHSPTDLNDIKDMRHIPYCKAMRSLMCAVVEHNQT